MLKSIWALFASGEALPLFANIASIGGLLLTLYVLRRVSALEKWYQRKARAPQVIKQVKQLTSRIADALSSYPTSYEEINNQISILHEALQSNKHLFQGSVRKSYKAFIGKYKKAHPLTQQGIADPREFHRSALMIIAGLESLTKNEQWRSQNA